jgi:DNA-binding IclR family transcriptional regulator
MDGLDSNKSATVMRALQILETLGEAGEPLTVTEVARAIGADRSTAYRMLATLLAAGYVARDPSGRRYRLGYKLLSLGRSILNRDETSTIILERIRLLSNQTGETVHYCVLDRDATVLVMRAKGTQLVAVDFQIGDRSPLHCTSIGKVLLAYQDDAFIEGVIRGGLARMARNTIVDPARLRAELATVRAQGFAYDDLEFHDDMRCVAVPLFEKGGAARSGISLSGPTTRYTFSKLACLKEQCLAAARELSRMLGGQSSAAVDSRR